MTTVELDRWCRQRLGSAVGRVLFRGGYFSQVSGVELRDGRKVVVKVRGDAPRLAGCVLVQRELHDAGLPVPGPVLGPVPFGPGRVATVEPYVEPQHGTGTTQASAALLARLVAAAPTGAAQQLRPGPAWVLWGHDEPGLWPRPDDGEVDLNSQGVEWIDSLGRDVREVLLAAQGPPVVGHVDWLPQNVWWTDDGTPLAVHDWDSVAALPEAAIAGVAAALHMGDTTVEQSAAFAAAYQRERGVWSEEDTAVCWAAGLWVRLFDAKKDLLCSRGPALSEAEARRRHRLARRVRRTDELVLRPVRPEDVARLAAIETDPRTTRHRPTGPPTPQEAERLLHSVVETWRRGEVGYWAVESAGRLIGTAGLRAVTLHDRPCWNLYYRLSPDVWGRGFASQAARAAVAYAAEPGGRPVIARTRPANVAAQRVALGAGLHRRDDLDTGGFHTFVSDW